MKIIFCRDAQSVSDYLVEDFFNHHKDHEEIKINSFLLLYRFRVAVAKKEIDMEKLALRHELIPAVGNIRVNARGDELGTGGQIIKTKEQILDEYYRQQSKKSKELK